MAGTGRQTEPPSDQVPDYRAEQSADDNSRSHGDQFGIHQTRRNGFGYGGAPHGAEKIGAGCQQDGLPGGQDFGGNDSRDRIGSVMKAVDVLEDQGDEDDRQEKSHVLGIFQDDVGNDVAGIAAAINDFF